jgi:hypothetical protein
MIRPNKRGQGDAKATCWIAVLEVVCPAAVLGGLVVWSVWMAGGVDGPPTAKWIWVLIEPYARFGLWLSFFGVFLASVVFIFTGVRIEAMRQK